MVSLDPSLNKHASVALVGLVMMFPVFNQIADTSLDALYNADHQVQWSDFFKSWDDIPEDEKLAYWDGKTAPPGGQDGDFDRDDLDDDFRSKDGDPQPREGDRDGDGVPDEEDPDPDDPNIRDPDDVQRFERRSMVLWSFNGTNSDFQVEDERITLGRDYAQIDLTYEWESFSGNARFALADAGGTQVAEVATANGNVPVFNDDEPYTEERTSLQDYRDDLFIDYNYSPFANQPPDRFHVQVVGYVVVPVEAAADDADATEDGSEADDDDDDEGTSSR